MKKKGLESVDVKHAKMFHILLLLLLMQMKMTASL
jgi:hypothetical protein